MLLGIAQRQSARPSCSSAKAQPKCPCQDDGNDLAENKRRRHPMCVGGAPEELFRLSTRCASVSGFRLFVTEVLVLGHAHDMTLPPERAGTLLQVKGRELPFSFFPMTRTNRRWGLNSMLYAAEPWAVISGAVRDAATANSLPTNEANSALSFVRQAKEYFNAAERAGAIETRPLLYYYSFLNLGKALSIARGRAGMVGKVTHGVAAVHASGYAPSTAEIAVQRSGPGHPSAIDELHWALEGRPAPAGQIKIADLMPQSVVGHRMWRAATGSVRKERFFALDQIRWMEDPIANEIWLKLYIRRDTLR